MSIPSRTSTACVRSRGVDGAEHSLEDYDDADVARPRPVVQPLPVRASRGRGDEGDPARLRRPRRARRRDQLERRRAATRGTRSRDGARAEREGFNFDYLHDEDQSVARALGSERTPEVFVFDRDRRLVYHGAIDDSRDETAVEQHYLRDALDALLAGDSAGGRRHAGRSGAPSSGAPESRYRE